ncbi:hypothetical protein D4764_03G0000140 [Takifugu flavidus]|uniref:Uncharacterized protein n=1 Tax=Takifugu flavidus TaxID=433684 RepID=A0A5C6N6L7_9TELE|nr:hypothetical protein D4764_03G0000140 [Takifugu flavidus]
MAGPRSEGGLTMQINASNQKKPDRDHMMPPHVAGSPLSARDRGSSVRRTPSTLPDQELLEATESLAYLLPLDSLSSLYQRRSNKMAVVGDRGGRQSAAAVETERGREKERGERGERERGGERGERERGGERGEREGGRERERRGREREREGERDGCFSTELTRRSCGETKGTKREGTKVETDKRHSGPRASVKSVPGEEN